MLFPSIYKELAPEVFSHEFLHVLPMDRFDVVGILEVLLSELTVLRFGLLVVARIQEDGIPVPPVNAQHIPEQLVVPNKVIVKSRLRLEACTLLYQGRVKVEKILLRRMCLVPWTEILLGVLDFKEQLDTGRVILDVKVELRTFPLPVDAIIRFVVFEIAMRTAGDRDPDDTADEPDETFRGRAVRVHHRAEELITDNLGRIEMMCKLLRFGVEVRIDAVGLDYIADNLTLRPSFGDGNNMAVCLLPPFGVHSVSRIVFFQVIDNPSSELVVPHAAKLGKSMDYRTT